jgi:hypothetical protein
MQAVYNVSRLRIYRDRCRYLVGLRLTTATLQAAQGLYMARIERLRQRVAFLFDLDSCIGYGIDANSLHAYIPHPPEINVIREGNDTETSAGSCQWFRACSASSSMGRVPFAARPCLSRRWKPLFMPS